MTQPTQDLVAEREREEPEHQEREADQQDRLRAEEAERAVGVLHVRPPQQVRDRDHALTGQEVRADDGLRPAVEREDDDGDDPQDHNDGTLTYW